MAVIRRPILVGGVAIAFSLWLLDWHQSVIDLGEFGVFSLVVVFIGLWLFQQVRIKDPQLQPNKLPLERATVEKVIAQTAGVVKQLATEAENHVANPQLQAQITQLEAELDRQEISVAVTGGKAVGKTTVIQLLSNWIQQIQQNVSLRETAALFTSDVTAKTAIASDLVLFLTNGDLTDSELQILQQLKAVNQRLLLVFNKQDQYLPDERATILMCLRQRVENILAAADVVSIAASPTPVKVRQQVDNSWREWMEQAAPNLEHLTQQLSEILAQESQQLIWATTVRRAEELKAEAKHHLNNVRRDRALPIIEQYQWIAATAAFANPVPALDLLATAAINAQIVIDLGKIYQQKLSWQQAQMIAGTMGSLMLKLGLVELSTKAISTVLKSNAVTFVAGGAMQGVSAAYLTRLAGMSLIEYFQQQEVTTQLNPEKLGQTLQNVFQSNQQISFWQTFVKQSLGRLLPEAS